jgi:hypothetical protein
VTRLRNELRQVWQRPWGGRLMPVLFAAPSLLVAAVWVAAPRPAGEIHSELERLQSADEIIGFVLTVAALISAYWLLAPDIEGEFESLSRRGGSDPFTFAAGRALVGAAGLLLVAAALGLVVEALDVRGSYQKAEALRVAVLLVNALPVFMLAMVLTGAFGRIIGMVAPVVLQAFGAEAAYQRGALADGFIEPTPLYSAEQFFAWLTPHSLIDPLPGIALMDQSVALQQFPVREGHSVWGADLIQTSGFVDVAHYAGYLLLLTALLCFVCWRRAVQARSRFHAVPTWTETRRGDHLDDENRSER